MSAVALLSIIESGDEYIFQLEVPNHFGGGDISHRSSVQLFDSIPVNASLKSQLQVAVEEAITELHSSYSTLARISIENQPHHLQRLRSLGSLLYRMLLPESVRQAFRSLPRSQPILFATNNNTIPWELLHDDHQFIALSRPIGRQLLSKRLVPVQPIHSQGSSAALVITNPLGDLPETEREIERIIELFDSAAQDIHATLISRQRATKVKVLEELASGKYQYIHYAGHARPGALLLPDGELTTDEIQNNLIGNPFVFVNGCWSAAETRVQSSTAYSLGGTSAQDLASAFILGGATGFLGSLWPVFDESSGLFAESFYAQLLHGVTMGEALQRTRQRYFDERAGDPLWASYVLYGNPTSHLVRITRRETRYVTALLIRLVGFTSLFEQLPLEQAARQKSTLIAEITAVIEAHGGQVDPAISTEPLIAYFGVRNSYEDNARRAVQSGRLLLEALTTAAPSHPDNDAHPISIRLCVITGAVIWEKALESALLESGAQPQTIYQLVGEQIATSTVPETVGREESLNQLMTWWNESQSGSGRIAGILGEPGVGKTHLVKQMQQTLVQESPRWIHITCQPQDQYTPYAFLSQLVLGLLDLSGSDSLEVRHTKIEGLFKDQLPSTYPNRDERIQDAIALLAPLIRLEVTRPAISRLDPELRQKQLAQLLPVLLRAQSLEQTLVMHWEDMHWIDEASLAVLEPLLSGIERMPILILAVYRPEWSHSWSRLPNYRHLPLRELDTAGSHSLLEQLLGTVDLPVGLAEMLLAKTQGNPLYIKEVVRMLQENGTLVESNLGWQLASGIDEVSIPDTLEQAILSRLAQLKMPSRQALDTAAVIGKEFEQDVLTDAHNQLGQECLDEGLSELTERKIVIEAGGWPAISFSFSHGIIHQTAYDHLLERTRRAFHRVIARILRNLYPEESIMERLAHHYYHGRELDNGVYFCLLAGNHAANEWSNSNALRWYGRAEEILSQELSGGESSYRSEDGGHSQLNDWRRTVLLSKADVYTTLGNYRDAIELYEEAVAIETVQNEKDDHQNVEIWRKIGQAHQHQGSFDEALAAMKTGLEQLDNEPEREAGLLHVWSGFVHFKQGQLQVALESCQHGISILDTYGSSQDLAQAYNLRGIINRHLGHKEQALDSYAQSIAVYQVTEYLPGLVRAYNNRGSLFQDTGRWDEALADFVKGATLAERTGEVWWQAGSLLNQGEILRRQGNLDIAIECNEQAQQLAQPLGHTEIIGLTYMNLGVAYLKQNQLQESEESLTEAQGLFQKQGAEGHLIEVLCYLAELRLAYEQLDQAKALAQSALDKASHTNRAMQSGYAQRTLGLICIEQDEFEAAEQTLAASVNTLEQQQAPYEIGLTYGAFALLYWARFRAGDSNEEHKTLFYEYCDKAIDIFQTLGAMLDIERMAELRDSM